MSGRNQGASTVDRARRLAKENVPLALGYVAFLAVNTLLTVIWNWEQGVGVTETAQYYQAVGTGWFLITFPSFVAGVVVLEVIQRRNRCMNGPVTSGRVDRGPEEHRYYFGKYGNYPMPRGPIGTIPENGPPAAIGFCPMCSSNARGTTGVRSVFGCPMCTFFWFDDRVGTQQHSFDDFFSPA